MARNEEYDWIDDAFDDAKPDPLAKKSEVAAGKGYDWIDDAFDESKEDPLAHKGMTGCSGAALIICVIIVILVVGFFVLSTFTPLAAVLANASM